MRKRRQTNKLITSVLFSIVALSALSQSNGRPTLVVGITIDQLRTDYIELLQSQFGNNGFNRLIRDGVYFENAVFAISNPNKATATALLYSGAFPNVNGISAESIYNAETKKASKILFDKTFIGNATDETFSPQALKVSTLSDELKMDNNGIGYVYAIAPDAQQAILMAGHAANGAFWINDNTGKWASTTFYKDFPAAIQSKNFTRPLSQRIDTMSWVPSKPIAEYHDLPLHKTFYPFKYTFTGPERYKKFKESALVNSEITNAAVDCINDMRLGNRATIDMLNIAYTASPYPYALDADKRIEIQDKYLKLDKELSILFSAIDKAVGRNAVIFVASTGYFDNTFATEPGFNIPSGEFSSKKAVSLLNMYLMAIYGNGNWVNGYYNEQVFLNAKLAKSKNIKIEELRIKSGEFMRRMAGVNKAYTIDEIINNPVGEHLNTLHKSTALQNAGDLLIEIAPGWNIVDDFNNSYYKKQVKTNSVSTPVFILAPNAKPQKVATPTDATILAPSISRILRIRSPNAAFQQPLSL